MDGIDKGISVLIGDGDDLIAVLFEFLPGLQHTKFIFAHDIGDMLRIHFVFVGLWTMFVLIQLHPQIGQGRRRLIVVSDLFLPA